MADWRNAEVNTRTRARRDDGGGERSANRTAIGVGRIRVPACRDSRAPRRPGFTLIEVLVALAIVSIALLAALRAAGQGTSNVDALRARLLAGWVAENVLAEQRARGDWPPLGLARGTQSQGGIQFTWREEVVATPNARFRRVELRVYSAPGEEHELSRLTGFVVDPPVMPP